MFNSSFDIRTPELAFKFAKMLRQQADDLDRHGRKLMYNKAKPNHYDLEAKRAEKALKHCLKKKFKNIDVVAISEQFGVAEYRIRGQIEEKAKQWETEKKLKQIDLILKLHDGSTPQIQISKRLKISTTSVSLTIKKRKLYAPALLAENRPFIDQNTGHTTHKRQRLYCVPFTPSQLKAKQKKMEDRKKAWRENLC